MEAKKEKMEPKPRKKMTFELNGKKYAVLRPNYNQAQRAQLIYNKSFREAVEEGLYLSSEIEEVVRKRKIWTEEKTQKMLELQEQIDNKVKELEKEAKTKSQRAKKLAMEILGLRNQLRMMIAERNYLTDNTAESFAENARFNYLVSVCTVHDDDGSPCFKDFDDYVTYVGTDLVNEASDKLALIMYGLEPDADKKLPENKYLIENGLMDQNLNLLEAETK